MTFTSFARASVLIAAAAFAGACDTTTRAPENSSALTPGAPAAATATPAGTSGSEPAPATPVSGPAAPAEATMAAPSTSEAAAAAPRFREVTIPAGTVLSARLNTSVGSDTSRPEQRVDATLTRGVRINGVEALGSGATLRGVVTNAERSGRVKGRASVAYRFNQLTDEGQSYTISTRTITHEAPGTKKRDAATIGVPAAGGAIIGGILGGKSGAVKGGAIGGAAGGAAVLSTRGKEVRLAPGATVSVRLASPLTVRVPVH
jgi:hypothetical protein